MRAGSALEELLAALRGWPQAGTDWRSVIALANHALLTPALFSSLARAGQLDRLPQDVGEYLLFIHDCNRERNLRLLGQLREAVACLNRGRVVPILLKGAVPLFLSPPDQVPYRMTSDLDIGVDEAELATAQTCLAQLGYMPSSTIRDMIRPADAGILELRPSQVKGFQPPELVEREGLLARVPSAEARAFHWIVHDQLKQGDYWRGRIDLRHLYDLAQLAECEELDWRAVRMAMPNRHARNAVDTQLSTLHRFFDVSVPHEFIRRPMIRFQHWRRVFSARHPVLGIPLRFAGNLVWATGKLWNKLRSGELASRSSLGLAYRAALILSDKDLRTKV